MPGVKLWMDILATGLWGRSCGRGLCCHANKLLADWQMDGRARKTTAYLLSTGSLMVACYITINHITGGGAEEPLATKWRWRLVCWTRCGGVRLRKNEKVQQTPVTPPHQWPTRRLLGNQLDGTGFIAFALVIGIRKGKDKKQKNKEKKKKPRHTCVMTNRNLWAKCILSHEKRN